MTDARVVEEKGVPGVSLITPAIPPTSSITPSKRTNIGIGIVAGLILGFIFAFVSESLDTSIATIEEIEHYLGIPVLGVISHIKKNPTESSSKLVIFEKYVDKSFLECWKTFSTNIDFAILGKGGNLFLLTSTGPGEGKTTAAVNLAIERAHTGKRTLLIDVDTRRPYIHKMFNMERAPGFMDLVLRDLELDEVMKGISHFLVSGTIKMEEITRLTGLDNLFIMGCGSIPPNPIQVISSTNMKETLEKLKKEFDTVIFDASPTLTAAVTSVFASRVDWVILVYEVGRVARGALRRTVNQLSHAKANILGVVLNKMKAEDFEPSISYYYKYRYYGEEKKDLKSRIFKKAVVSS